MRRRKKHACTIAPAFAYATETFEMDALMPGLAYPPQNSFLRAWLPAGREESDSLCSENARRFRRQQQTRRPT